MGVDRKDYVIVGYKMPYKIHHQTTGERLNVWDDEKFLPMIEGHQGEQFSLIVDGMSGEYMVFGKELAESDEYTGFEFNELSLDDVDFKAIENRFMELFGEYLPPTFQLHPKVLVFTHYH